VPFDGGTMLGRGGYSDVVPAPAMAQRWRDVDRCPAPVDNGPAGAEHRFTATGCAGGAEVVFVQLDGAGHTWPGSAAQQSGQFFATHGR
jgi:polyhydroxybutyrate depolymerase